MAHVYDDLVPNACDSETVVKSMPVRSMDVAVATCITKNSLRPNKRLRASEILSNQDNFKEEEPLPASCDEQTQDEGPTEDKPKQKRNWECWESVDIDFFFEALSEYGKDFDKIHRHMKHKLRNETKNKDQIRFYYYRTWNKISKHLSGQLEKEKRAANELYCLICYGELRKKGVKGFGKKQMNKLAELLEQKWTMVRYRGRNIKLKPPSCKALKKLQDADAGKEKERLSSQVKNIPQHLCIELIPASNDTWCAVQKSANNPRLRFSFVDSKLKLNYITEALRKKFKCGLHYADSQNIVVSPINVEEINESILYENLGNDKDTVTVIQNTNKETLNQGALSVSAPGSKRTRKTAETRSSANVILSPCSSSNDSPPLGSANATSNSISQLPDETSSSQEGSLLSFDWQDTTCGNLTLSCLYLAMGKPDIMRLKYSFEKDTKSDVLTPQVDNQDDSLVAASVKRLLSLVSSEYKQSFTPSKRTKTTKKIVSPKTTPLSISSFVPICPSTVSNSPVLQPYNSVRTSPETMLPPKDINLPALRKRGRNTTIKPVNIVRRTLIPKPMNLGGSKTLLPGAVAVNIVPQPAQLVQFAQVPPVSAQLTNSGNAASSAGVIVTSSSTSQSQNKVASSDILSKAVAETLQGIDTRVQVLDEGFVGVTSQRETQNPIQLNQLIHLQDSNSSATWSTMLPDIDLSFLNSSNSNQNGVTSSTITKENSLSGDKREDSLITALKNGPFSTDSQTKTVTVPSVFVNSDDSIGPFSQLSLSREILTSTSPTATFATCTDSQRKLSVLTTPIKDSLRTPTKPDTVNKENVCSVRIPSPTFESNSWLTSEVADISIGGIIGEINKEQKIALGNNVSTTFDCILDENSVDFVNRFKDLTAKMAASTESTATLPDASKRVLHFKDTVASGLNTVTSTSYDQMLQSQSELSQNAKDIPMPIYHAEESTGPLDGLAFVLPTNDSGSLSDSVKGFSVGQ